jgi:DNA-binding beta-propeller fold protein YncE
LQGPQGEQGPEGPEGPVGPAGPQGPAGANSVIKGSLDSVNQLYAEHPVGQPGESYIVDGELYVWDADTAAWENVGQIQGPPGTAYTAYLYVTNPCNRSVEMVNADTGVIEASIDLAGHIPGQVGFNPVTGYLYLTDTAEGALRVVNTADNTLAPSITLPAVARDLAVSANANRVFVVGDTRGEVYLADGNSGQVITLSVPGNNVGIVVNGRDRRVFVADMAQPKLVGLLETTGRTDSDAQLPDEPRLVAVNPRTDVAYALLGNNTVAAITYETGMSLWATVPAPAGAGVPAALLVEEDTQLIYEVYIDGQIFIISGNTNTQIDALSFPGISVQDAVLDQDTRRLYLLDNMNNQVSVLDTVTRQIVQTFPLVCPGQAVVVHKKINA